MSAAPTPLRTPRLNPLEQVQRGRKVVALRSQIPPMSWSKIAVEVDTSARYARVLYEKYLAIEQPLHDPLAVVDETIDVLTAAMHAALEAITESKPGTAARNQAIREARNAAMDRLHVMRAAGRAPRSLAGPSINAELAEAFKSFASLLERHEVPDEALQEFLVLADAQMAKRQTTPMARPQLVEAQVVS